MVEGNIGARIGARRTRGMDGEDGTFGFWGVPDVRDVEQRLRALAGKAKGGKKE